MLQFTSLYSLTLDVPVTVCVVLEYSFFIFALPPFNILASKICNQEKKRGLNNQKSALFQ